MKTYLIHRTVDGERWDQLAWRYYRDLARLPDLIAANPHLPITPVLGTQWTVLVPIVTDDIASTAGLPPWRR